MRDITDQKSSEYGHFESNTIEEIYLPGIYIKRLNLLYCQLKLQSSQNRSIRECNCTIHECNAESSNSVTSVLSL